MIDDVGPLGQRHDTPQANGPLSWRDVYTAVRDSEDRVVQAIAKAITPLSQDVVDHESRLRKIESGDAPWINRYVANANEVHRDQGRRLGENEAAIVTVRTVVDGLTNREKGIVAALTIGQKFTLTLASIVSAAAVVIALITAR